MTTRTAPTLTSAQTVLQPTVSGLDWLDAYQLGGGLDAVTGDFSAASALAPFEVKKATTHNSQLHFSLIQSESDVTRLVDTAASGMYNFGSGKVSASASFLDKISISEQSLTILYSYQTLFDDYDRAPSYALSNEASKLAHSDPAKFRQTYGDYFVSGMRRGSRFTGVYVCTARTVDSAQAFAAEVKAESPDLFSAAGSVKFEATAKKHDVEVEISIDAYGHTGSIPSFGDLTPATVTKAYEWFIEHEAGEAMQAYAQLFSSLDPALPRTVPVAPSTFVELRELYDARWVAIAMYSGIPELYQDQLKSAYDDFVIGLEAEASELPTDATGRDRFQKLGTAVIGDLTGVAQRQAFYSGLAGAEEAKKGEKIYVQENGPHSWAYGFSRSSYPGVSIHSTSQNVHQVWHTGKRQKTLTVGPDASKLMVGWTVHSVWPDLNGHFEKAVDRIIGTDQAAVFFSSLFDRGYNWTLTVYWVDADDYQFGDDDAKS